MKEKTYSWPRLNTRGLGQRSECGWWPQQQCSSLDCKRIIMEEKLHQHYSRQQQHQIISWVLFSVYSPT